MNETTRDVHKQSATTGGEGKAGGDVMKTVLWRLLVGVVIVGIALLLASPLIAVIIALIVER